MDYVTAIYEFFVTEGHWKEAAACATALAALAYGLARKWKQIKS